MAVGLPLKTTYANGDVYSASDVNDTNGTINLLTSSTLSLQAGKNPFLNSDFSIWQRGTSLTVTGGQAYTADRWVTRTASGGGSVTTSRQATNDTTNLAFIRYCARYQRVAGNTDTAELNFFQMFETANSVPFAGKTVTLSFYARKGANYSPTSSVLNYRLTTGTGTDQNWALYTGAVDAINANATLTTTWQRFTTTATLASNISEMYLNINMIPTGTAGAADYFEITGVQLELGSTPTTFSRAGGTIQGELAACQRYYALIAAGNELSISMGANYTTSQADGFLAFPVTMRTTPTLVATSGTGYYSFIRNGGSDAFNSLTLYAASLNGTQIYNSTEISGTAGHAGTFRTQNASASIAVSAEL
jgi:hypothetical protein